MVIAAAGRYTRRIEERVAADGLSWETFLSSPEEQALGQNIGHCIAVGWGILAIVA